MEEIVGLVQFESKASAIASSNWRAITTTWARQWRLQRESESRAVLVYDLERATDAQLLTVQENDGFPS